MIKPLANLVHNLHYHQNLLSTPCC